MCRRAAVGQVAAVLVTLMVAVPGVNADCLDTVGYSALKAELGERVPTGRGVLVTQVEGSEKLDGRNSGWAPDASTAGLAGKSFRLPALPSDHGTMVGLLFYGSGSMAPSIAEIECYPSGLWASDPGGFLRPGTKLLPMASRTVLANHSYVGAVEGSADRRVEMPERLDYLVAMDDFVQVVGVNNAPQVHELWQCTYNAIVVGCPSERHAIGTLPLGSELYGAGRAKPELVAPMPSTSEATAVVSSAAAMLMGFAHSQGSAISTGSYVSPRTGRRVYHAEASEVIKAALLAGAERAQRVEPRSGRGRGGRARPTGPQNGMDPRLGAGSLNVRNSYYVLAAGEQDGVEGESADRPRVLKALGFDYNPAFGGAQGTARRACYRLVGSAGGVRLRAVLAWNLRVNESRDHWDGRATLYDLDLKLYDLDTSEVIPVAQSDSWVDNAETIRAAVIPGHAYELRVVCAARQSDFLWDYALAWQMGDVGRRRSRRGVSVQR